MNWHITLSGIDLRSALGWALVPPYIAGLYLLSKRPADQRKAGIAAQRAIAAVENT